MVSANGTISKNESLPQDRNVLHEGNNEKVPWKLMLYKLYGNEAELFLNANMHFKKRLNPRLLKLGGKLLFLSFTCHLSHDASCVASIVWYQDVNIIFLDII